VHTHRDHEKDEKETRCMKKYVRDAGSAETVMERKNRFPFSLLLRCKRQIPLDSLRMVGSLMARVVLAPLIGQILTWQTCV
jgi:hypothetical protein